MCACLCKQLIVHFLSFRFFPITVLNVFQLNCAGCMNITQGKSFEGHAHHLHPLHLYLTDTTALPSAQKGCSQSHVLPKPHRTGPCNGFLLGMSFHLESPEEKPESGDHTHKRRFATILSNPLPVWVEIRIETHTCSMGIPSSAPSLL